MTHECLCILCFFNLCCSTAAILWSGLSEIIQKAATHVALWPSVKSTKRCQSPNPKPRQHHMFASYEIGTSCPSLTAIKRYDLDKSADVLLMDHLSPPKSVVFSQYIIDCHWRTWTYRNTEIVQWWRRINSRHVDMIETDRPGWQLWQKSNGELGQILQKASIRS